MPTSRNREALLLGRAIFAEIEREWAEALSGERVDALRETLQEIPRCRLLAVLFLP